MEVRVDSDLATILCGQTDLMDCPLEDLSETLVALVDSGLSGSVDFSGKFDDCCGIVSVRCTVKVNR